MRFIFKKLSELFCNSTTFTTVLALNLVVIRVEIVSHRKILNEIVYEQAILFSYWLSNGRAQNQ